MTARSNGSSRLRCRSVSCVRSFVPTPPRRRFLRWLRQTPTWTERSRSCASSRSRRARGPARRGRRKPGPRTQRERTRHNPCRAPVRVVIADDETLLREGLARLLSEAGIDVVGTVGTAEELLRRVELTHPDV